MSKLDKSHEKHWNTSHLGWRLGSDVASAVCASSLVAPVITVIDRAVIENASGRNTLMKSVKTSFKQMFFHPRTFFISKPFGLIFMLYSGTYVAANTTDTCSSLLENRHPTTITTGAAKFLTTSATNLSLCLYKDAQFTRLFGPAHSVVRPVAPATFALFALRDSLTIFASFNLPPRIAPLLPMVDAPENLVSKLSVAQFFAPASVQLISTPFHLLGLDLYNNSGKEVHYRERWARVKENWVKSSIARICRIVPAFGIGGVVNSKVRYRLMSTL
ncbi:hypothetical protein PLICRDRAFT_110231 [Plicaturopsis crispa FD-325 SS-3]|nr:hypothetical protein PLICRDRAFT_110231 [Plicaturopsis crispa FD-325 SS-3]